MASRVNALKLRRTWGPKEWYPPVQHRPNTGTDSWLMVKRDQLASIIVTCFDWQPMTDWEEVAGLGGEWVHASIARVDQMPSYEDLAKLHRSVWGDGAWSYQMFVPQSEHVNFHQNALHLWGRRNGAPLLPNFRSMTEGGLI